MTTTSHDNEPSSQSDTVSAAARLRSRFLDRGSSIVVCPGVYDELTARIALSLGFEGLYLINPFARNGPRSEAGSLYSDRYGIHTQVEAAATLSHNITATSRDATLITDADTAYGGPIMIKRTIRLHKYSNVTATHIDDRSERPEQGQKELELLSQPEFRARIQAAVEARDDEGNDILIIVRTLALQIHGWNEAMERMKLAKELGADAGFLDGVRTRTEAVKAVEIENFPMIYMVQGLSPPLSVNEAQEIGYAAIIFPLASIGPAYRAICKSLETLRLNGQIGPETSTPTEINGQAGLNHNFMSLASYR